MFTVRKKVNFHFFRFEVLIPKIVWQVACDVGVGCLFWKGKKIRGTFKEEEKYRGELIMVSLSLRAAESSGPARQAAGRASSERVAPYDLSVMYILLHTTYGGTIHTYCVCALSRYNYNTHHLYVHQHM